jgi:ribonuclease J
MECVMQIKVHRGTHQIGGSITEIKTAAARIIIDMGAELPSAVKKESADADFNIEGVTTGVANCDAVFITHYHGDHVGLFEKVLPEIPIFMGATAKRIFSVVQTTLKKKLDKGNPELVDGFKTFEAGKPLTIKDIKITPYTVDHSAFDAYMLLIEAEGKRILHTGDFRMHGVRGRKMPLLFEKYAGDIDALIIEGTMLSRPAERVMTEHELGAEAKRLLCDNKSVFVLCSATNIDSIAEFYSAAIANKKPFIVCEDDFQLEILRIVTEVAKSPFYDFNKRKIYTYSAHNKKLHDYMSDCGFCMIGRTNYTTQKAMEVFPDNLLIYSMWSGYLDKKRPAFDEYKSGWIDNAISTGGQLLHLHTSGHATAEDIKRVCEITRAKMIIPIHGEQPEAFMRMGINSDIRVLHDGEEVQI